MRSLLQLALGLELAGDRVVLDLDVKEAEPERLVATIRRHRAEAPGRRD